MTGHACATSAHAAVHSIPKYKKETAVPFLYLKRDTNTGGAEVPLSWNNVQLEHWKPAVHQQTTKSIKYMQNRYYNWKLWCVESDLGGRKFMNIFYNDICLTITIILSNK